MQNIDYSILNSFINLSVSQWRDFVGCLNYINTDKILINITFWPKPVVLDSKYKAVLQIFPNHEYPDFDALIDWCKINPGVQFFCLYDGYVYDYPLVENLQIIEYNFQFIPLAHLLQAARNNIIPVSQKKITHKFSSLTNYKKQLRAAITAKLLTHAKNQSIISWQNSYSGEENLKLIESIRIHPSFADLDWSFLNKKISVDDWQPPVDPTKCDIVTNTKNTNVPAYENCLINFTNETVSFGMYYDLYNRPGPFISEKTWRPIASGCIFIPVGQPDTYKFLQEKYGVPCDFSFSKHFDSVLGDLDRTKELFHLVDALIDTNLDHLIESNYQTCSIMQQTVLHPEYIEKFHYQNQLTDQVILQKLSKYM